MCCHVKIRKFRVCVYLDYCFVLSALTLKQIKLNKSLIFLNMLDTIIHLDISYEKSSTIIFIIIGERNYNGFQ